jgi:hypothetical protein
MSKLHELKIKYEQSQLAESAAWGVLRGHYANTLSLNSDEAYRDYSVASNAWRQAHSTYMEDSLLYRAESDRRSAIVVKVLAYLSGGLAVVAAVMIILGV